MGTTILQVVWIILIVCASILGTFLILSLIFKLVSFLTFRFNPEKVQKGELIKKKFFVCRDGYHLNWFGEINPQGTKIIIGIHDLGMSSEDFLSFRDYLVKTDPLISLVSYDQRYFGKNEGDRKRNAGSMIVDLQDIIANLQEKYPHQEIILLGEGLGYYLANYVAQHQPQIQKVIGVGLRNHEPYKKTLATKMTILSGIIFSPYQLIGISGEGHDLSLNPEFVKKIDNRLFEKGQISVKEYFQHRRLISKSDHYLRQSKHSILILQPQNDIYVDLKKTARMLDNSIESHFQIEYFAGQKHFLMNELNNQAVFLKILDWVK